MKLRTMGFYLVLLFGNVSIGSEWTFQVQDEFQNPPGRIATPIRNLAVGKDTLLVTGSASKPDQFLDTVGIIRQSLDSGKTWKTLVHIEDFFAINSAVISRDLIFVTGTIGNKITDLYWSGALVKPNGSIQKIKPYRLHPDGPAYSNDTKLLKNGVLIDVGVAATGQLGSAGIVWKWITRESVDQGANWKIVDEWSGTAQGDTASPQSIAEDKWRNVFVAGIGITQPGAAPRFHIRRRNSKENTWGPTDTFPASTEISGGATELAYSAVLDRMFAAGSVKENGISKCLVRSSKGPKKIKWATSTQFAVNGYESCELFGVSVKDKMVAVVGSLTQSTIYGRTIESTGVIRISEDGGKSWDEPLIYKLPSPKKVFLILSARILNRKEILLFGNYRDQLPGSTYPDSADSSWSVIAMKRR